MAEYSAEAARAPMVMIREGRYKFIHCESDPPQLFDLESDPEELSNLAATPNGGEQCARFADLVNRRWDLVELDAQIRRSQSRRALVAAALGNGAHAKRGESVRISTGQARPS